MQVKKQQLEPDMEQQTGSKLGKEYVTAVYCHPTYIWNPGLDAYDTTIMAESEEELKSLLMTVKEESENVGLKLNVQKTIMASGPITSWQIDGETTETVTDFIFLGSIITADGDCSHEIKRRLLLGRKVMSNLALPGEMPQLRWDK